MGRPRTPEGQRPVFALRLANSERKLIEVAAGARAESLAAFIRRAAVDAARRELAGD